MTTYAVEMREPRGSRRFVAIIADTVPEAHRLAEAAVAEWIAEGDWDAAGTTIIASYRLTGPESRSYAWTDWLTVEVDIPAIPTKGRDGGTR